MEVVGRSIPNDIEGFQELSHDLLVLKMGNDGQDSFLLPSHNRIEIVTPIISSNVDTLTIIPSSEMCNESF